jgi:hypothetical protein
MAGEFGPDGTQALPPLPVHVDALSGLADASTTDPASWSEAFADAPDTVVPPPVPRVQLDPEHVRAVARREVARDRSRRAQPSVPFAPAQGLPRTPTAPNFGLPAARGMPVAPDAIQQQAPRRNAAAGCIGCAVVLVFVFIALAVVVVALGSQQ